MAASSKYGLSGHFAHSPSSLKKPEQRREGERERERERERENYKVDGSGQQRQEQHKNKIPTPEATIYKHDVPFAH
jgi:hypothetical protein